MWPSGLMRPVASVGPRTAGLMLDKMDVDHVPEGAEVWEKVIRKLRGGMMPPQGMPRPDEATNYAF